jgi:hypothetical protein
MYKKKRLYTNIRTYRNNINYKIETSVTKII